MYLRDNREAMIELVKHYIIQKAKELNMNSSLFHDDIEKDFEYITQGMIADEVAKNTAIDTETIMLVFEYMDYEEYLNGI